ncbi:MAG TPA: BCCT family transporter [Bacillota bacterium]|nr:BCCT family transporter [Bacillota bacterium]
MDKKVLRNPVFISSSIFLVSVVLIGIMMPAAFGKVVSQLFDFTTENFGWFYLLSVFIIIIFLIGLAISKYGSIRLGEDGQTPDFPFFTWIGMLFSAGFGAGLVFWGVAEPMSHFFTTPFAGIEPQSEVAARLAMGYSFFHWGMSQWSLFAMVGLVIGFLQFRKKKNGLISTALEPVLGKRPSLKHTVDSFAVISTVMGVATSVGLGVLQTNGGLHAVFDVNHTVTTQMIIIGVILVAYMLSSTTGLQKGIRYLSNLNLGLALGLLLFTFIAGPTVFILESFTLGIGDYITNFIQYSLRLEPYKEGTWVRDWTIFYWAWAIAWSPFVGAFVARVSRGRTIREYIFGVMVVPPLIACLWIAVFGGTALWNDLHRDAQIAEAVNEDLTLALFQTFAHLPFTTFLSIVALLLIFTFLVTSADSATYILASMTAKGSLHPPLFTKVVWGALVSLVAAVLLFTGGLEALQTASLISALPFTVVLLLLLVAIVKLLNKEMPPIKKEELKRFKKMEKAVRKDE